MKKMISALLCALLVFGFAFSAFAVPSAQLSLDDIQANPGDTVTVALRLKVKLAFCYLKVNYSYDADGLELISIDNGSVSTDAFTVTQKTILWDSLENAIGAGVLCTFTFTVKDTADGSYNVRVNVVECYNYDEQPVALLGGIGTVTVTKPAEETYLPGDVDLNGKVETEDARHALRASIGLETFAPDSVSFRAADVDGNKKISPEDARYILRRAIGLKDPEIW